MQSPLPAFSAQEGAKFLWVGTGRSNNAVGGATQTINDLEPGARYSGSYYVKVGAIADGTITRDQKCEVAVSFGEEGESAGLYRFNLKGAPLDYVSVPFSFIADDASGELQFEVSCSKGAASGIALFLDNVRVAPA